MLNAVSTITALFIFAANLFFMFQNASKLMFSSNNSGGTSFGLFLGVITVIYFTPTAYRFVAGRLRPVVVVEKA